MYHMPLPTEVYMSWVGGWNKYVLHSSLGHAKSAVSNKTYRAGPGKIYHLVNNDWVLMYDVPKIERSGSIYGAPPIDWDQYKVVPPHEPTHAEILNEWEALPPHIACGSMSGLGSICMLDKAYPHTRHRDLYSSWEYDS